MDVSSVKPGDIVEVDKKGRRFHAIVREKQVKGVSVFVVAPLDRRINYFSCTANEVVGIWHKSRRRSRVRTNACDEHGWRGQGECPHCRTLEDMDAEARASA